MKSVSELGLKAWGEFGLSLKKAGFEPHHIHQVINSKDNKLAEAMFQLFELHSENVVLRLDHQDRVGRCYEFDWQETGSSFLDLARIITFSDSSVSIEDAAKMLIDKGMTYSKEEIAGFGEMFLSEKGFDLPDLKQSMTALVGNHASCVFFMHNEDKTGVSVVYPRNTASLSNEDAWKLELLSLDDSTSKLGGYNHGDDEYSTVGLFINVQ